jgi:hypothetical protein
VSFTTDLVAKTFNQVGLSLYAITHWVTLSNFIYLPVESQQFGLAGHEECIVKPVFHLLFHISNCMLFSYPVSDFTNSMDAEISVVDMRVTSSK